MEAHAWNIGMEFPTSHLAAGSAALAEFAARLCGLCLQGTGDETAPQVRGPESSTFSGGVSRLVKDLAAASRPSQLAAGDAGTGGDVRSLAHGLQENP